MNEDIFSSLLKDRKQYYSKTEYPNHTDYNYGSNFKYQPHGSLSFSIINNDNVSVSPIFCEGKSYRINNKTFDFAPGTLRTSIIQSERQLSHVLPYFFATYVDIDGDATIDLVYNKDNQYWIVYTNIPAQFVEFCKDKTFQFQSIQWSVPDSPLYISKSDTGIGTHDTEITFTDFNGDGLPDLLKKSSECQVWLNKRDGFNTYISWNIPNDFGISRRYIPRNRDGNRTFSSITDLNADGLPDYLYKNTSGMGGRQTLYVI